MPARIVLWLTAAFAICGSRSVAVHAGPTDTHVSGKAFVTWVRENAIHLKTLDWREIDLSEMAVLDKLLEGKRIVYLGEPDHYIHEKCDFRLIFIRYLFERGWRHIGVEMGRSDGKRVEEYLQTGDTAHLNRVATLGYKGDLRVGRKHTLKGLTGEKNREFWERAWSEHRWFLSQLYSLNESLPDGALRLHWFGYDVDTRPGGGYTDARQMLEPQLSSPFVQEIQRRLAQVDGESRAEEIARLESLLDILKAKDADMQACLGADAARELQRTLRCLTDGLTFVLSATNGLGSPEGKEGLRRREERMFRYMDEILEDLLPTDKVILLGHNMHLSKDSGTLLTGPVDSGAPRMWPSIGSHVAERLPGQVFSIWMLYDHGRHARLMRETIIEEDVISDPHAIEHILAKAGPAFFLPFHSGDPREAYLEHPRNARMNGRQIGGTIGRQTDAIFFVAEVHEPGWLRPEDIPESSAAQGTSVSGPSHVVTEGFRWTGRPVEFKDGTATLRGTIFIPDGASDVPGVVILGGSERGPRTRLKERLAEHFAGAGVAALIYDSAGTGQSTGNALLQTREARAEEALAAVRCVRSEMKVHPDQVGILGISEGALVTLLAAARDHSVAFAIPVSGSFGVSMTESARYRIEVKGLIRRLKSEEIQKALLLEEILFALMSGPELFEWRLIEMKAAQWPRGGWHELVDVVKTMRHASSPTERQEKLDTLRGTLQTFRAESWFDLVVVDVDRFDRFMAMSAEYFYTFLEKGSLANGDLEKVRQELEQCPRVRCPVLAVWGENDEFLPPHRSAAFLKNCLRCAGHGDATYRIVPNASHILTSGGSDGRFADGFPDLLTEWLSQRFALVGHADK